MYFSDHDAAGGDPPGGDFNDKLLLNLGPANPGFFVDATAGAFAGLVPLPGSDHAFPVSSFGVAAEIADLNGDGARDIVKQTALTNPLYVGVAYSDAAQPGAFDTYEVLSQLSPYYVAVGDLNNDDRLDLVVTDDGNDRYLLNQGNGADGLANFAPFVFSFVNEGGGGTSADSGFGGDSRIADLDNDGWRDVVVTDVHVELPGCTRRLNVYRNLGGGGNVTLEERTAGEGCQTWQGNPPSCEVIGLPSSTLEGVHDAAILDLDGDGWNDMVLGRCAGLVVLMNQPGTPAGAIPDGGDAVTPLLLDKLPGGEVGLAWSPSCVPSDADYAVYRGPLGTFASHVAATCTTGGLTSAALDVAGDAYFLVVPHNGTREGSYGHDSTGAPRPPAAEACRPQLVAVCE